MERADTRGMGNAKRLVATFLEANLPGYVDELRELWARDEKDMPLPLAYTHNEPQALDKYPMLSVAGVRTSGRRRVEHQDGAGIVYQTTYGLRVFVWVRDAGWDRTIDVRDDLTAAISTLLLDRQTLDAEGTLLDETTLVEEYSDVTPVRGDRFVAGAYVAFDLLRVEALRRDQLGTVASVELETTSLPHPALA